MEANREIFASLPVEPLIDPGTQSGLFIFKYCNYPLVVIFGCIHLTFFFTFPFLFYLFILFADSLGQYQPPDQRPDVADLHPPVPFVADVYILFVQRCAHASSTLFAHRDTRMPHRYVFAKRCAHASLIYKTNI